MAGAALKVHSRRSTNLKIHDDDIAAAGIMRRRTTLPMGQMRAHGHDARQRAPTTSTALGVGGRVWNP